MCMHKEFFMEPPGYHTIYENICTFVDYTLYSK